MVKYGRAFHKGLATLASADGWAHIDYDFYKQALKALGKGELPVLLHTTDFSGEGPEAEAVRALDAAFRRALLSDIVDVDACFARQCTKLREQLDLAAAHEDENMLRACREHLLELHRWSALNYLAVLKIVKKHDKSGLLEPLREAAIAALGRASFVKALEWSEASQQAAMATTGGESDTPASPADASRRAQRASREEAASDGGHGDDEGLSPSASLSSPYRSLIRLLPEPCEAELQAILREVASEKYQPRGQLRTPQRPEEPPPMAPDERAGLLLTFGVTYLGYATLLAAKKPFAITKHALSTSLGLSPHTLGAIDTAQLVAFSLGSLFIVPRLSTASAPCKEGDAARNLVVARPLALSLVGSAGSVLFAATQSSAAPIVLAAFCNGLFASWAYPVCVGLLNPWLPAGRRSRLMGYWGTTGAIGNLAGSALGYACLKHASWRASFGVPAALLVTLHCSDAASAYCIALYDLGSLLGSLGYSAALDRLTLGALFAPLSLLLALCLLLLTTVAALGPWAFAPWLLLLGSTLGGLELIASGSAAGAIVDLVGGSIETIPTIVGGLTGLGSLASLLAVSGVGSVLRLLGWEGLYFAGGMLALLSAAVLTPMALRPPARPDRAAEAVTTTASESERRGGGKEKHD